jgi:hypothetical protein
MRGFTRLCGRFGGVANLANRRVRDKINAYSNAYPEAISDSDGNTKADRHADSLSDADPVCFTNSVDYSKAFANPDS